MQERLGLESLAFWCVKGRKKERKDWQAGTKRVAYKPQMVGEKLDDERFQR